MTMTTLSARQQYLYNLRGQVLMGLVPASLWVAGFVTVPMATAMALRFPSFLVLPPIFVSAYFGGFIATMATTLFVTTALALLFLEEVGFTAYATVVAFVGFGAIIGWTHERLYRRNDELRDALRRLEHSEQVRTDFLANLSHELRTPLNVIMGYARMITSGQVPPTEHVRMCGIIERNTVAQLRLIEDLLDIQRIGSGRIRMEFTLFDLDRVAHSTIDSLRPQADAKRQHLFAHADPIRFWGDPARIQQVLWNLLSNAIKFTPSDGCIGVHIRRNGAVEILVEDSGEGIPKHFLPHVFERFRQLDSSPTRRHFGMGLGLAIVKEVVTQHHGEVWAESDGPGLGARFCVRLPIRERVQ